MDHQSTDDETMLAALSSGEGEALSRLMSRHAATVTRYAWALAENAHDVEEIVQDTFVTLWERSLSVVLVDTSLLPWLLTTARNHAMNLRRRRLKHRSDQMSDEIASPSTDLDESRDRLRWVMSEIEQLAPIDRRVCELCLIEGRPYAEVAEMLGVSLGAVKQRVVRSRLRLRRVVNDSAE